MTYKGRIEYTIKETHPDKDCVIGGWKPNKIYDYEDEHNEELGDFEESVGDALKEYLKGKIGETKQLNKEQVQKLIDNFYNESSDEDDRWVLKDAKKVEIVTTPDKTGWNTLYVDGREYGRINSNTYSKEFNEILGDENKEPSLEEKKTEDTAPKSEETENTKFKPTKETIWDDPKHPLYGFAPSAQNEEFLSKVLEEMRKYQRNWSGMSLEDRRRIDTTKAELDKNIKQYERALEYIRNYGKENNSERARKIKEARERLKGGRQFDFSDDDIEYILKALNKW